MTKRDFILQGFTSYTHARAVRELFDVPHITQVILSIAFVNEGGVQQIEDKLKAFAKKVVVFAGIRNDITSYQGLRLLHSIIGSNLHVVDTGARHILFHPKLYLARGKAHARLIMGSANLTLGGLNNNIEASMILDFDLTSPDDKTTVDGIDSQLTVLPASHPDNIVKVASINELDDMFASGRIVDETVSSAPRIIASTGRTGVSDTIPLIKLKVMPKRRNLAQIGTASTKARPTKSSTQSKTGVPIPMLGIALAGTEFKLIWESKPLTRRDLTIPDEKNTNPTGSMNLDKGLLPEEVDHRHYFRDDVFYALMWKSRSTTVDEASAKFRLIVKGINHGEFDLSIHHTISTTSKTYQQHNAMTRLSWGGMRKHVALPALINRTLFLYRDKVDPTQFTLEID